MGTLTIIGRHLHVHRHQINMFLSSPRKGKKGSLQTKCTVEGFRGRGRGRKYITLQTNNDSLYRLYTCMYSAIRFRVGKGEQDLTLDYIAIKIVLLKWISTKIQLTPKATRSGIWLRRDDLIRVFFLFHSPLVSHHVVGCVFRCAVPGTSRRSFPSQTP